MTEIKQALIAIAAFGANDHFRKYLTRTKPKTMLKIETNTHNEHQEHFPHTEYSQGTLEKHTKTGGSQKLFTHQHLLPTSTSTNTVNRRSSILETSLY